MTGRRPRRRWAVVPSALAVAAVTVSGCASKSSQAGISRSVFHLKAGDCVSTPATVKAELTSLRIVSCRQPHAEEVYALVEDRGTDTYPGTPALQTFANGACLQQFRSYVGSDYRDSSLFYTYLLPSVRSWASGDRTVDCVVTTTGRTLTRSVKGTGM